MDTPKVAEFAHIGKSVIIKGELSGSEDLYVDGKVEGTIELQSNSLIVGPNGQVHADVNAKGVIVQGKLEGKIRASERAELRKSAIIVGDIVTQRIAIEEGAYFKGKVDVQREGGQQISRPSSVSDGRNASPTAVGVAPGAAMAAGMGTDSLIGKTPVTEQKKF